jgi:ethanolamine utilization protein EutA
MAAFGSGAVALSGRTRQRVLTVHIGGGTSKLALCENGAICHISAIDIGARVVAFDTDRPVMRLEEAGKYFAKQAGVTLMLGAVLTPGNAEKLAASMVDHLFEAMKGGAMSSETAGLHRMPALTPGPPPDIVTISGGVSEFLYTGSNAGFSDLGPLLAKQLRKRIEDWRPRLERPEQGISASRRYFGVEVVIAFGAIDDDGNDPA